MQGQQRHRLHRIRIGQPGHGLETHVGAAERHRQRRGKSLGIIAHSHGVDGAAVCTRHIPQTQRDLGYIKGMLQTGSERVGQLAQILHLDQGMGPLVNLVGDGGVLAAVAHHVHDAMLQTLDLLAQHLGLTLLQADGTGAVPADQANARQHLCMALEEIGVFLEVVGNRLFSHGGVGQAVHKVSGRSIWPSKTNSAGPVMRTRSCAPPAHSMVSRPPRVCTSTR